MDLPRNGTRCLHLVRRPSIPRKHGRFAASKLDMERNSLKYDEDLTYKETINDQA